MVPLIPIRIFSPLERLSLENRLKKILRNCGNKER
jgi:hypothetical protein